MVALKIYDCIAGG